MCEFLICLVVGLVVYHIGYERVLRVIELAKLYAHHKLKTA